MLWGLGRFCEGTIRAGSLSPGWSPPGKGVTSRACGQPGLPPPDLALGAGLCRHSLSILHPLKWPSRPSCPLECCGSGTSWVRNVLGPECSGFRMFWVRNILHWNVLGLECSGPGMPSPGVSISWGCSKDRLQAGWGLRTTEASAVTVPQAGSPKLRRQMAVLLQVLLVPGVPGLWPPCRSHYLCLCKAFSSLPNLPLPPSSKAQPTLGQSSSHSLCTPGGGTQGGTGEAAGSPGYGRCPIKGARWEGEWT